MADNVAITAGSGTTIATDDIGGVQYQRIKIGIGADGSATDWSGTNPAPVQPVPGTAGGWSVSKNTGLTNTKTAVKASAGQFGGYIIWNPNTAEVHIQVWDIALGSVTVGTTAPTYVITIPPQSTANLEMTHGIAHATAITIAATTTATNGTAPSSALQATILYK